MGGSIQEAERSAVPPFRRPPFRRSAYIAPMFALLKLIQSLFKALHSEGTPGQVAAGMALARRSGSRR